MIRKKGKSPFLPCLALLALLGAGGVERAGAQASWRPEKPVELILPTAAGGANDNVARLIQRILQDRKLVPAPVLVMNKAGGNQTLAPTYLRQHARDPHFLLYSTSSIFTAQITGLVQQVYTDLAPIALLLTEYSVLSVSSASPLRTISDLTAKLKSDPQSVSFGLVSRGGSNHIALSQVARAAGIDSKRLKVIVFKTNVESYLGVAGGHIDAVASSATAARPFVQQGTARVLMIAAPRRQPGTLAQVPTLKEQGIDVPLTTNWRGVFGAPGIAPPQAAFWEDAFAKMAATEDWKRWLEQGEYPDVFARGPDFARFLEAEYQVSRTVLTELGYARAQP
ncbi:MAG: tripartite tricarboxylate transporter substrate binding protein [Burkholderiales bacterium]|nr:tripartite tricarboxylate transporter substrate binding protein [Burkholderiales bacterium]